MYSNKIRDLQRWLEVSALTLMLALLPLSLVSCIDEDLSDCGTDYAVNYRLVLEQSLTMSIDEALNLDNEQALAEILKDELSGVTSNRARLVDLSFYHIPQGDLSEQRTIRTDASELSLSFYMQPAHYGHIALAATQETQDARIEGRGRMDELSVIQNGSDTIDSHTTGIYMGYCDLDIGTASATFHVPLYMQNAISIVVIDRGSSPATIVNGFTRGTATGLACADSVWRFDYSRVIRNRMAESGALTACYAVCFPSAGDDTAGRTVGVRQDSGEDGLWFTDVYTRLPDGKYVKNVLSIKDRLKAGTVHVVKMKLSHDGQLVSNTASVGVSVTLDWKPGGDYDIDM